MTMITNGDALNASFHCFLQFRRILQKFVTSVLTSRQTAAQIAKQMQRILIYFITGSTTVQLTFCFLKNRPTPASFCLFSTFSNNQYNFYKKSIRKNVHPLYGAGIRTPDLSNMSRLPLPIDQGSRP